MGQLQGHVLGRRRARKFPQAQQRFGAQWQRALRVQRNPEAQTSKHRFPARTTDRVLIWLPAGGSHPERPNLTWMTEVEFVDG